MLVQCVNDKLTPQIIFQYKINILKSGYTNKTSNRLEVAYSLHKSGHLYERGLILLENLSKREKTL